MTGDAPGRDAAPDLTRPREASDDVRTQAPPGRLPDPETGAARAGEGAAPPSPQAAAPALRRRAAPDERPSDTACTTLSVPEGADRIAAGAILVISTAQDVHAAAVMREIARINPGAARLLDLSTFPVASTLDIAIGGPAERAGTAAAGPDPRPKPRPEPRPDFDPGADPGAGPAFRWTDAAGPLDLSAVRAVWWRRPQPFGIDPAVTGIHDRNFALSECHSAVHGLWRAMTDAVWINHPTRDEDASRKVVQLRVAHELGLAIPDTLITNDPARARAFIDRHGPQNVIYKAFTGTEEAWRETRRLRPGETDLLDAVRHAPVIFQRYIPAGLDLRVTMIDGTPWTGAIHTAGTAYETDFRMVMDEAAITPIDLPPDLTARLRALMDRFGLTYGAIDIRRTPDGRDVFLEINPAGQWLFVEQATGLPIARALAHTLMRHATA